MLFSTSLETIARNALNALAPNLIGLLKVRSIKKEYADYFFNVVSDTVKYREQNGIQRNDFLDLLMKIKKGQNLTSEENGSKSIFDEDDNSKKGKKTYDIVIKRTGTFRVLPPPRFTSKNLRQHNVLDFEFTMDVLAAQCFVWFIGGYETSSITLTFAFFELARNREIQARAQEEIDAILDKHNGKLTYEILQEMTYLDMIVSGRCCI